MPPGLDDNYGQPVHVRPAQQVTQIPPIRPVPLYQAVRLVTALHRVVYQDQVRPTAHHRPAHARRVIPPPNPPPPRPARILDLPPVLCLLVRTQADTRPRLQILLILHDPPDIRPHPSRQVPPVTGRYHVPP